MNEILASVIGGCVGLGIGSLMLVTYFKIKFWFEDRAIRREFTKFLKEKFKYSEMQGQPLYTTQSAHLPYISLLVNRKVYIPKKREERSWST